MHPVEIARAAQRDESLVLPERPPSVIFGSGELRAGARPFELVALGIEIESRAPGVGGPSRAAAHAPHIETAAEAVEAKFADARGTVMVEHAHQHAARGRANFLVTGKARDRLCRIPGNAHGIAVGQERASPDWRRRGRRIFPFRAATGRANAKRCEPPAPCRARRRASSRLPRCRALAPLRPRTRGASAGAGARQSRLLRYRRADRISVPRRSRAGRRSIGASRR